MAASPERPNASRSDVSTLDPFSDIERRHACKTLRLHDFCGFARCRRTHRCTGDPRRCFQTHGRAVPQDVRTFAAKLLVAARSDSVRPGEGMSWLNEMYPRETQAFEAWSARFAEPRQGRPKRTYKKRPRFPGAA
jgi:hypothetical protein